MSKEKLVDAQPVTSEENARRKAQPNATPPFDAERAKGAVVKVGWGRGFVMNYYLVNYMVNDRLWKSNGVVVAELLKSGSKQVAGLCS